MLERDIAPLGGPFLDSLQPPLLVLDQIAYGRPAGVRRGFHSVPLLEDFRHRRGHRVLRLLRIPVREDDVPQQRLMDTAEELLESSWCTLPTPAGALVDHGHTTHRAVQRAWPLARTSWLHRVPREIWRQLWSK